VIVPERLASTCRGSPEGSDWLERLPELIRRQRRAWSLEVGPPFLDGDGTCAWVAPVTRADGTPAVLKLGMPHFEAAHESAGLRFWSGEGAVRLLEADDERNAMLLERCEPGTLLRASPEPEQDRVIAGLLRRLWRRPAAPHPFRPLSEMVAHWCKETRAAEKRWPDVRLVEQGLRMFEELAGSTSADFLLATDLHAGNVLRAQREPWLMIDPKPFLGDPSYDATQHLFNCPRRMRSDPLGTIGDFGDLLEVDAERVRKWMLARAAAEPREDWTDESLDLARMLSR
jgi:streptomycin 6-kinase